MAERTAVAFCAGLVFLSFARGQDDFEGGEDEYDYADDGYDDEGMGGGGGFGGMGGFGGEGMEGMGGLDALSGMMGGGMGGESGGGHIKIIEDAGDWEVLMDPVRRYTTVVAYFASGEDTEAAVKLFDRLGEAFQDVTNIVFAAMFDDCPVWELETKGKVKTFKIIVQKPPELLVAAEGKGRHRYPGARLAEHEDIEAVRDFVVKHGLPLVGARQPGDGRLSFLGAKIAGVTVFVPEDLEEDPPARSRLAELIAPVAQEHPDLAFVLASGPRLAREIPAYMTAAGDGEVSEASVYFGLDEFVLEDESSSDEEEAGGGIAQYGSSVAAFSEDALTEFLLAYKAGGLARYFRPPPAQEQEEDSPEQAAFKERVRHVGPAELRGLVKTGAAGGLALVLLYAPWCGHCTAMKPAYAALAERYADSTKAQILAVDATAHANLPQSFAVEGYPTLYYVLPGATEPEKYDGGRSFEDFDEFITHATNA
ncbi:Protein disulfide-isomerase tigA [Diplonema papillatum]|nr:Protein disulfide-isomerase tigA [Diplonema papillatum]